MMMRFPKVMLATALAMGAFGCPSPDNNENGATNNGADMGVQEDMNVASNNEVDMSNGVDMNVSTPDMADPPDMMRPAPTCAPFTTVAEFAAADDEGAFYVAESAEDFPYDELSIEIYDTPPAVGTYPLGENYETCTYCVLIFAGCGEDACDAVLFPTSGTLEITAVGGEGERFTGSLTDVQFEEVTIDEDTFRSTAVPGGELRCIDSHAFDMFIGNACAEQGDLCEVGVAVENPDYECVDDGSGTGFGTCELPVADCVDGPSGSGPDTCENTVTCDGVEYKIDCTGMDCSCLIDGVEDSTITSDTCSYDGLRQCGAPIPPVNPTCDENDIFDGGGGDFCEAGVTCNDVDYVLNCDNAGECTCTVDGAAGPMSTANDCLSPAEKLRECGAPLL